MTTFIEKAAALAALPLLALATGANAHAALKASMPAANATVAAPATINLTFTESLTPKFSSATLMKADGSAVAARSTASGKSVTAKPAAPLTPGAYMVMWSVVASDGHKSSGNYSFTVK
jgi:methionine-rich copper-binding protein CopC